jgi:hypothetical protein
MARREEIVPNSSNRSPCESLKTWHLPAREGGEDFLFENPLSGILLYGALSINITSSTFPMPLDHELVYWLHRQVVHYIGNPRKNRTSGVLLDSAFLIYILAGTAITVPISYSRQGPPPVKPAAVEVASLIGIEIGQCQQGVAKREHLPENSPTSDAAITAMDCEI